MGAEDDPTRVAFDNSHLHLKGKVTEVGSLSKARLRRAFNVVSSSYECAVLTIGGTHIPVAAVLMAQWVVEGWRPACGLSVDVLWCNSGGSRRVVGDLVTPQHGKETGARRDHDQCQSNQQNCPASLTSLWNA